MQSRYLVTGLVVVLAAVTGVLIYQGNQTQSASTSDVTVTETSSAAGRQRPIPMVGTPRHPARAPPRLPRAATVRRRTSR